MRYFKKWCLVLLAIIVAEVAFDSCSSHYRFKKMIKRRRGAVSHKYASPYLKKIRTNAIPINTNYIIRNVRNKNGAPNSGGGKHKYK